ncbi:ankyrin repeat-containing protein [Tieghemostelium lacteum]|uniref:Ankyrin repeat-containing protein n=1 Tax=Tieghemostelium lacteum TaxID=361077 RepID=A0A151Z654_TIELA|nr:ankyrin repeat-containing protein [Tieghemostelium lacteum]|eukprot:KYQ89425.1 ankyrin repeat-containing protein [Tieghemostelium lacteum]
MNIGEIYEELNDCENSKKAYLKALELDKGSGKALQRLGSIHNQMALKFQHLAIEYLQESLKINPKDEKTHHIMGKCYKDLSQPLLALECFTKGILANPTSTILWYEVGLLYEFSNQYYDAYLAFERGYQIDPTNQQLKTKYQEYQLKYQHLIHLPMFKTDPTLPPPPPPPQPKPTQQQYLPQLQQQTTTQLNLLDSKYIETELETIKEEDEN